MSLEEDIIQAEETKKGMANQETIYTIEELAKAAKTLFGVQPECVYAAFFMAKKTKATENQAKSIVKEFMTQEVK